MSELTMQSLSNTVTTKKQIRLGEASDERLAIANIEKRFWVAYGGSLGMPLDDYPAIIKSGSLWWVGDEMTDLIDFAAPDFPAHVLQLDDVTKEPFGVVMFSHPMAGIAVDAGVEKTCYVSAMSWSLAGYLDKETGDIMPALHIVSWSRTSDEHEFCRMGMKWFPLGQATWHVGKAQGEGFEDPKKHSYESVVEDCSRLMTMRMLATQPGIAETTERKLTRPERKRSERSGATISPIKIVNVRGLRSASGHGEAEGNVEWSHRWMVGGHWRNQPFGPERAQRRPVWVAPYVKGPADKPLVVKETIKVLK